MAPASGVMVFLWMSIITAEVLYTPQIVSWDARGRLTSTTVLLDLPLCHLAGLSSRLCPPHQCEVWLVVTKDNGMQRFESEKTSSDILTRSPYPDAFLTPRSPHYFLTRVGNRSAVPCEGPSAGLSRFRVGAEGHCEQSSCNGALPPGSTVRVKYVLVNPRSKTIQWETSWSQPLILITPRSWGSIDEWMGKRSGGMVVITVISSCLLTALLLLLGAAMLLDCCGFSKGRVELSTSPPVNTTISNYNTHHLSDLYSNDL